MRSLFLKTGQIPENQPSLQAAALSFQRANLDKIHPSLQLSIRLHKPSGISNSRPDPTLDRLLLLADLGRFFGDRQRRERVSSSLPPDARHKKKRMSCTSASLLNASSSLPLHCFSIYIEEKSILNYPASLPQSFLPLP